MTDKAHVARRVLGVAVALLAVAAVWAVVRTPAAHAEAVRQFTSSEQ